jgi:hypothetical protein
MAQSYFLRFGSGQPSVNSGLSPTFIAFVKADGTSTAPPSISAVGTSLGIYTFSYGVTQSIAFVVDGATTGLANSDRYIFGAIDPSDRISEYGNSLMAYGASISAQGVSILAQGTSILSFGVTLTAIGTSNIAQGLTTLGYGVSIYSLEQAMSVTLAGIGTTLSVIGISLGNLSNLIGSTASSFGTDSVDPVDLFGYLKRTQEFLEGNQNYTKIPGSWDIYSRGSSQLLRSKTLTNSISMVVKA